MPNIQAVVNPMVDSSRWLELSDSDTFDVRNLFQVYRPVRINKQKRQVFLGRRIVFHPADAGLRQKMPTNYL